jgi:ribosomal protein S18 acetylase RimI-like enzyme
MKLQKLKFPSDKTIDILSKDTECNQYLQQLINETYGEILYNPNSDELVGYVFVYHSGRNRGFMFNLWVNPKYRNHGLGTILAKDAVMHLNAVDLTVDKNNYTAIRIYKNLGFEISGNGNTSNEYYMKKRGN